nr:MAG TPA: hypothetical protein [Crassvirales sp.]
MLRTQPDGFHTIGLFLYPDFNVDHISFPSAAFIHLSLCYVKELTKVSLRA